MIKRTTCNLFKPLLLALITLCIIGCSSSDDDNPPATNNSDGQSQEPQRTNIPDENFEASLIALNFDNELDGSVLTSSLENVTSLVLNDQQIADLTGIEDMPNLENLWANNNLLTALNVNQNTRLKFIFVDNNQIASINTASLADLEKLSLINNVLTGLDVSNNFNLQILTVPQNGLTSIDVSSNSQLDTFSVLDNPLTCIKVSAAQLTNIPPDWQIDPEDNYAITCN